MTELLAAIGSLGTIGGIAAVFTLAIMLSRAKDAAQSQAMSALAAERLADGYHTERDLAVAHAAQSDAAAKSALAQLSATAAALAAAREELIDGVHARIEGSSPTDAARIVDGVLARRLSAGAATTASDDHGAASAVPATGPAGDGAAGGDTHV